jgi:hypothetical protein
MASGNADGGIRMSQVMNADPAKFCFFARLVMNPAMHITRIEWLTVLIDVIPRKLPWFGETFWVPKMPMIIS